MAKTYRLVACGMLAALAFILQIANPILGLHTGFGMTIDLVAVPVMLALFMFGVAESIEVLSLATIFIALFAPTGIVGALMKFAATAPIIILAALNIIRKKGKPDMATNALILAAGLAASTILFWLGAWIYDALKDSYLLFFGMLPILAMAGALYLIAKISKPVESDYRMFENSKSFLLVIIAAIIVRGIAMIIANYYFAGPLYFKISAEEFIGYITGSDILFFGKGSAWYLVVFAFNALQAVVETAIAWALAYKFGLAKRYSEA